MWGGRLGASLPGPFLLVAIPAPQGFLGHLIAREFSQEECGFGAWLLTLTSVGIVDRLVLWPRPAHDLRMKSRVHPKYKTTYRVGNWREYERALVQRGDVTLWLSAAATDAWRPSPSGRPGGQKRFSDVAIETALILRLVFGLPLRQTEGFVRSVLALMGADLDAPDHTTLSRRSQPLAVMLRRIPALGPIHLIVDSTGLSIVGQGAWAAVGLRPGDRLSDQLRARRDDAA